MKHSISIKNAKTHNLKNISLDIERDALVVITGVSGSGKSSLAFDTLYAEGQRRYVESLSAYARQFLERMDRPDVDEISGIAPAVAIEQKNPTRTSRSTVGTATEIQDHMRLLFARIGHTMCPTCHLFIKKNSVQDVLDYISKLPHKSKIAITFPAKKEESFLLKQKGFYRAWLDNRVIKTDEVHPSMEQLDMLVDRLSVKESIMKRAADSVEQAFLHGHGYLTIHVLDGKDLRFSQHLVCPSCQKTFIEPQPRMFSFNNPFGACPECKGFGDTIHMDPDLVIPDKNKSIRQDAITPWKSETHAHLKRSLVKLGPKHNIDPDIPYHELDEHAKTLIWEGFKGYPGLHKFFEWMETKKYKIGVRVFLSRYRGYVTCFKCKGSRLRTDALNVYIRDKNIGDIGNMTIRQACMFFDQLELSEFEYTIAQQILKELRSRLAYLDTIGLGYLTLNRRTSTLSGGEFQRINLASALGAQLVDSLYILDEPTIGLHPRDTQNLIKILQSLRDIGNTVIVVEHDRELMHKADSIIDLGPGAGDSGGQIVFEGRYADILENNNSLTGAYLKGTKNIPIPSQRKVPNNSFLTINQAREHNLKNITVDIPLKLFTAVTGVSGSGKSTLIHDVLYAGVQKQKGKSKKRADFKSISGTDAIDEIILVDQNPIGKTPRSNPITYIKGFDHIRKLFASTTQARILGLSPGAFSFNVAGGRCETCEGAGVVKIEMQFLADLYIQCETCAGKRYKKSILDIHYKGKNIADVLEMTVTSAIEFFKKHPNIVKKLNLLQDVGLGYMRLGQASNTLSGGEAQRIKLAANLDQQAKKHILYIFDEPTTGLHFNDVSGLLQCFQRLLDAEHSLVVIEHNMDIIKCADYIIDMGPEGGDQGGYVIATGSPEVIAREKSSYTGQFLQQYLKQS